MMGEDQAKTKWCFAFTASHTDPRVRQWRSPEDEESPVGSGAFIHHCIGSECMAWRIRHQWLDNSQQEPDWVNYAPYAFTPGPDQERDDGYCGLAGETGS